MLLQIMEEGRLTDSFGRHVDFRNVHPDHDQQHRRRPDQEPAGFGFGKRTEQAKYEKMKEMLDKEVEGTPAGVPQPPRRLSSSGPPREDLNHRGVRTEEGLQTADRSRPATRVDPAAKEFLIDKGYNPEFGAGPLRRAIEPISKTRFRKQMLRGEFKGKNLIRITVQDEDNLRFEGIKDDAVAAEKTVVVNTQPS